MDIDPFFLHFCYNNSVPSQATIYLWLKREVSQPRTYEPQTTLIYFEILSPFFQY